MITVDDLKRMFGVQEDQELAPLFGRKKGAVSVWRKSGVPASIEAKARRMLTGEDAVDGWPDMLTKFGQEYGGDMLSCEAVDIYNMVEAGGGAEPEWHEPIDRRAIPTGFLKKNIRPVLVRGRSMEPTFKNGAIIGVDQGEKQVIEGEAYAIMLPYSGAAVKRLYPLPDGVLIRSDNKEFPEVKLKKDEVPEFFILGRVCWVVQEV